MQNNNDFAIISFEGIFMFGNSDNQKRNRIIDGDFVIDRYVTVSINGQVHSRKVRQDHNGAYIEIDGTTYKIEDFE